MLYKFAVTRGGNDKLGLRKLVALCVEYQVAVGTAVILFRAVCRAGCRNFVMLYKFAVTRGGNNRICELYFIFAGFIREVFFARIAIIVSGIARLSTSGFLCVVGIH